MSASRNYSFTYNNYPDDYKSRLIHFFDEYKLKYMICGEELGENKTPHIQGHVTLTQSRTIKQVQRKLKGLDIKMTLLPIKSTPAKSIEYCKKDGQFWDKGDAPKQGKRTDLINMMDHIKGNPTTKKRSLMEAFPMTMARYPHFAAEYKLLCMEDILQNLDWKDGSSPNLWIYGPPGAGKSRAVREAYKSVYSKQPNKWWDGFDGQQCVLIEDIEPMHEKMSWHLKIWADRYPFIAQIKGSSVHIRPDVVIVTSNYTPESIFADNTICEAISRRFTLVNTDEDEWRSILPATSGQVTSGQEKI